MSMTRRDYVALAGAIAAVRALVDDSEPAQYREGQINCLVEVAGRIADVCSANPRFDRARFLAACGVGGGNAHPKAKPAEPRVDRSGCIENPCTCHDDTAWQYYAGRDSRVRSYPEGCSCGCRWAA